MSFNWDDYDDAAPAQTKAEFNWDDYEDGSGGREKINPIVSGARKLAQGASAGFLDEASGGVEAVGRALGFKGAGGSLDDVERSEDGPTLDLEKLKQSYEEGRDRKRKYLEQDSIDNPATSAIAEFGGAVLSPVNKIAPSASMAKQGAIVGGLTGLGSSEADNLKDAAIDTATGVGLGGAFGYGADKAAPLLRSGMDKLSQLKQKSGEGLKRFAEKAAVNATGATGKQASTFSDDAGRELLDRGIVGFGDSQSQIASKAGKAVDAANEMIDSSLKSLDNSGVNVDTDKIRSNILNKIDELSQDPSQVDIVNLLKKELDNLDLATEARSSTEFGLLDAENIKRGFNRKAGNWMDPEKGQAGKEMYQAYRGAVEDAAQSADPSLAKMFTEGKKSYGLLRPIEEAAERRANTTAQSPVGGFLDVASGALGAAATGPVGGVATAVGRRLVAPRISSSVAVASDKVAKMLMSTSPRMSKMASENPKAFGALVNSVVSKMEGTGSQLPRAADKNEQAQSGSIMNRLANDPNGMNYVSNDRLKKQIQNLKQAVPQQEAQAQFINEN